MYPIELIDRRIDEIQRDIDSLNVALGNLLNREWTGLTRRLVVFQVDRINDAKDTLAYWQARRDAQENK